MSHVQHVDELIREYLLYRGFSGTVKAFDSELKVDKDKSFRVRKYIRSFCGMLWLRINVCVSASQCRNKSCNWDLFLVWVVKLRVRVWLYALCWV